jgi:hypothetical protein
MINGLGVIIFGSRPDCWNPVLSRIEQSENSELLTPNRMQSQETFSTGIVVNFFRFPAVIHTPKSDKQNKSYGLRNTVHTFRNFSIDEKRNRISITR